MVLKLKEKEDMGSCVYLVLLLLGDLVVGLGRRQQQLCFLEILAPRWGKMAEPGRSRSVATD